ncbi:MAG: sulfurtransferase complex subunit TusB [Nitrospirae bacterium]|nr:sulfurtransferase complex subunit TusB [Nitrospirota bacterium]
MKLGVFMSDFKTGSDVLNRLSAEKLGIILVGNGIYHATVKDTGKASSILDKSANFYVLAEDLESRGFNSSNVDSRVKVVTYGDVVDLMFNDYEKVIWI